MLSQHLTSLHRRTTRTLLSSDLRYIEIGKEGEGKSMHKGGRREDRGTRKGEFFQPRREPNRPVSTFYFYDSTTRARRFFHPLDLPFSFTVLFFLFPCTSIRTSGVLQSFRELLDFTVHTIALPAREGCGRSSDGSMCGVCSTFGEFSPSVLFREGVFPAGRSTDRPTGRPAGWPEPA